MNFLAFARPLLRKAQRGILKNAPHILMGIGTGTGIAAVIFAVNTTPAAESAILKARFEKLGDDVVVGDDAPEKLPGLTKTEVVKACWKYYIPAAGMELISLTCFWGAHGIDIHRQAVLAGLATTAEEALREYQRKTAELIGKNGEEEIRNSLAQNFVDKNPPPESNYYIQGGVDQDFVYKGQYFRSSFYKIKEAENLANHQMIQHMYISEQELMWLLDPEKKWLKPDHDCGQVGWSVDELITLDIRWAEGPNHQPIGCIQVVDSEGRDYYPSPGFSRLM